ETPTDAIEIKKYLEDRYRNEYSIKRTWDTGLEIWNKDAGKAQMIRYLREKLDNIHTVICAGDYENDIAMLEESDLSYAPANALEGAKEAADVVGVSCAEGLINQIVSDLKQKLS
ncbi:MAG: HAD family hydrolase, partial [Monoglobaceae bacterium]